MHRILDKKKARLLIAGKSKKYRLSGNLENKFNGSETTLLLQYGGSRRTIKTAVQALHSYEKAKSF